MSDERNCAVCGLSMPHTDLTAAIECQLTQLRDELHLIGLQRAQLHNAAMQEQRIDRTHRGRIHEETIGILGRMVDLYFQAQGGTDAGGPGPLGHLNKGCVRVGCGHAWMRHLQVIRPTRMVRGCTVPDCGCTGFQVQDHPAGPARTVDAQDDPEDPRLRTIQDDGIRPRREQ